MLEEVKSHIKVIGDDEDQDIIPLIERGKKYLFRLTGTSLNFEEDDLPKQLLLEYCRYARNNALEFFNENYASDILLLSLQEGVKNMGAYRNE